MINQLPNDRSDAEAFIRTKLIEFIRLSAAHGIDLETLMYETLDECDPEPS